MDVRDAVALLSSARDRLTDAGPWVDVGCGAGTFTRALAELLPSGCTIEAVDRDAAALRRIPREHHEIAISTRHLDVGRDALPWDGLRGALMANVLHYLPDAGAFLERVRAVVRPAGHVIVVEYDTDDPQAPWVPHPTSQATLARVALAAGFTSLEVLGDRPSRYGGRTMYGALLFAPP